MPTGLPAILHRIYQFGSEHLCCITIAPIPREREPRGATQPLAKLKTTRSAAKPLLRCLSVFDSLILHVPAGDRNSKRAQELFRPPRSPASYTLNYSALRKHAACWPSPNSPLATFSQIEYMGEPRSMFIDYVMTMCDQILRRAAEENPGSTCLQNIPADNKDEKSQISKETN